MSFVAFYLEGDFPCCILKVDKLGHLCGYVGLPPGHPWYGKHDGWLEQDGAEFVLPSIDVHGGVTWSRHERRGHPAEIAWLEAKREQAHHLNDPGVIVGFYDRQLAAEREGSDEAYPYDTGQDVWWIGFDCGHYGDANNYSSGVYRDEAYVRREISGLVAQAAQAVMAKLESKRDGCHD